MIELIVVMAIIGILAAVIIPAYAGYTEKAREKACGANRGILLREYSAWLVADESLTESNEGFQAYLQAHHETPLACPSDKDSLYTWDIQNHTVLCPNHGKRVYSIQFTPAAFPKTMDELYFSFDDYMKGWKENLPRVYDSEASLKWNWANLTGKDEATLLQVKFWKDYFAFANVPGLNSTNASIDDFKVFFKRDINGVVTRELAGVYFQVGATAMIRFADGTTVKLVKPLKYGDYINPITHQLEPPK